MEPKEWQAPKVTSYGTIREVTKELGGKSSGSGELWTSNKGGSTETATH
jgi:hypothetical protein